MNRWLLTGGLPVSLALAMSMLGCGGSVATEAPGSTATTVGVADAVATKAPIATPVHGHARLAAEALGEVPLRSDQRAQVEKLAATTATAESAVRAARRDLIAALADQMGQGQIDRSALQPKIDAIATAALSTHTTEQAGLQQLHGILDPGQRSLFVDTVRAKIQARWQEHGEHPRGMGGMKARWADLNLTEAQEAQIQSIMHDQFGSHKGEWKGAVERSERTLDSFKGEVFTPAEPDVDVRAKASEMTGRFVDIAARVLPILTPEQRVTAVAKLRARATKMGASATEPEENAGDPLL
jgi:Spy/CpxP family protein refolding chaperone